MSITLSWSSTIAGLFSYGSVFSEEGMKGGGYWQSNSLSFFFLVGPILVATQFLCVVCNGPV